MKVCVKTSAIAADSFTVLPHGVVYINEDLEPRLAKRVAVLCQKFPEDIFLYEGELEGLDIKGSRNQELDAQADAEAEEILAKAKAQKELLQMQQEGRLAELNADNIEAQELTKRQEADMSSDSWLSKNIRPGTLIFILVVYASFAIMSAFEMNVHQPYVELLGQWGMLIMSFYFGGRTLEKIMDMKSKKNDTP